MQAHGPVNDGLDVSGWWFWERRDDTDNVDVIKDNAARARGSLLANIMVCKLKTHFLVKARLRAR